MCIEGVVSVFSLVKGMVRWEDKPGSRVSTCKQRCELCLHVYICTFIHIPER